MFCENCLKNLATVWVTKIYGDTVSKSHLCQRCAEELTQDLTEEWPYVFSGLLSSSFPAKDAFKPFRSAKNTICPICKITYGDFLETGNVGCPDCYNSFKKHMDPLIKQVHGSLTHVGKLPKLLPEEMKLQLQIKRLKSKLFKFINEENYEKAANIRDEINNYKEKLKEIGKT